MIHGDNATELVKALVAFQATMKGIEKDGNNPHFRSRYATLSAVLDAVRKPLTDNGLAISQSTDFIDGKLFVTSTLYHTGGAWMINSIPIPLQSPTPQSVGSAQTYGQRYSLMALLCLALDDDDGNTAQGQQPPQAQQAQQVAPPPPPKYTREQLEAKVMKRIMQASDLGLAVPNIDISASSDSDLILVGKRLQAEIGRIQAGNSKEETIPSLHPALNEKGSKVWGVEGEVIGTPFINEAGTVVKFELKTDEGLLPVTVFSKRSCFRTITEESNGGLTLLLTVGNVISVSGHVDIPENPKYQPSVVATDIVFAG